MNAASKDISDILVADTSLGLIFATNLFIGKEPAKPNDCVTIFDTVGYPPQLTLDGVNDYYYPSIQIRVRHTSYLGAADLSHNIMVSLHGRNHETVNSTLYTLIKCASEPALLDWDENNRVRFITNFEIQRR